MPSLMMPRKAPALKIREVVFLWICPAISTIQVARAGDLYLPGVPVGGKDATAEHVPHDPVLEGTFDPDTAAFFASLNVFQPLRPADEDHLWPEWAAAGPGQSHRMAKVATHLLERQRDDDWLATALFESLQHRLEEPGQALRA
jgi:hypothetical protein